MNRGPSNSGEISQNERVEGWKDIAKHLKRGLRTVQRWERKGLPIHRHDALGLVYAFKEELDSWLNSHPIEKQQEDAEVQPEDIKPEMAAAAASTSSQKWARPRLVLIVVCMALAVGLSFFLIGHRGKQTSLQQLGPRSLAVLGFRNLTGGTEVAWLSTALSEMLTVELSAGGKLNPVSGEDVIRVKRDLSFPEADGFSKETLDRIRKYLGPVVVLSGSYVSLGKETASQIRLQLVLQDTETGETIATLSETGTEGLLFDLVSRTGALLREKLRVGEVPASEALNPKNTLPRNLEAQRLYSEGLNKLRLDEPAAARDALELAVRADPDFALGHSVLADAWSVLGYEDKAKEEANIAFTLSSTLAPEEALSIEAKYRESAKDWSRSVEIYQKLCQFSPNNLEYRLRLVKSQTSGGEGKEALTTLAQIRKLPSPITEDPRIDLAEALIAESLGDFMREQASAARAVAKGESRGMRLLTARAQLRECWAFYKLGQPHKAIETAQEARQAFKMLGDRGGEAQALKNLADVVDDQGDHAEGRRLYEAALKTFHEIGQESGVAATLNNLAYAIKSEGDLAGARGMFEESLTVYRKLADEGGQAVALNGIASVVWRQGDLEEARRMYENALRIDLERDDKSRAATVLGNLAIVLQDQGSLSEARKRFEESLAILRKIDDKSGIARTLGNIGELLATQGDLVGAKERFEKQLAMGQAIPENQQRAYALFGLGEVLLAQGDLKGARAKHEEGLALRAKMGERGLAAESRLALDELALEEGNATAAEPGARQVAAEFRSEKEFDQEASAWAVLARALAAQHKNGDAEDAIGRATEHLNENQDRGMRLRMLIIAGCVRAAVGQTDRAKKDLHYSLAEARRLGYVGSELESRLALEEIELRSGNLSARAHLAALENDASKKGFGLIARKAAAARSQP